MGAGDGTVGGVVDGARYGPRDVSGNKAGERAGVWLEMRLE